MEILKQLEDGMKAFDVFKSEIQPKLAKLEGLDSEKLAKLEKSIGDAIELSQKESAKAAALEAQVKSLEAAFSRPSFGEKKEEVVEIAKKAFNEFAKSNDSNRKDFSDFVKQAGYAEELKALSVGSDPNGGYLVLPTFGGIINTKVFETSPIRQLATVETINSDVYEVVLDYDETGATWVGETQSRSATTTPALGKLSIPVHEMNIQVTATQKILDDGIINFESWLATKVGEKAARKEATAFVAGTGSSQPRGLLTYTAGTDITAAQIEQVNAGSTSAFTYAGLANLQNALKEPYQANAVFLMKRASFGSIMQIVTGISGDNRPIFNMMYDKNTGLATAILGKPVMFADDVAAISSASLSAIYGDIRAAYTIVDRIGLRTLRDPYTNKPYVVFDTTKRVGGAVVNYEAVKIQKMST